MRLAKFLEKKGKQHGACINYTFIKKKQKQQKSLLKLQMQSIIVCSLLTVWRKGGSSFFSHTFVLCGISAPLMTSFGQQSVHMVHIEQLK